MEQTEKLLAHLIDVKLHGPFMARADGSGPALQLVVSLEDVDTLISGVAQVWREEMKKLKGEG